MFKKGQRVVKLLHCAGATTASIQYVETVRKGVVRLYDSSYTYDAKSGREIEGSMMGSTEIVYLEGGVE